MYGASSPVLNFSHDILRITNMSTFNFIGLDRELIEGHAPVCRLIFLCVCLIKSCSESLNLMIIFLCSRWQTYSYRVSLKAIVTSIYFALNRRVDEQNIAH